MKAATMEAVAPPAGDAHPVHAVLPAPKLVAPGLRAEVVGFQRGGIGADLPGDVGDHGRGRRLSRPERAAGVPEREEQQGVREAVVRAALGRGERQVIGGQGAVAHHLPLLRRQREHRRPVRLAE